MDKTTKRTLKFVDEEESKAKDDSEPEVASETEIVTEIIVPEEGGWGWLVVAGSFTCLFILDGIYFTFGSIYKDMSDDLAVDVSSITLISSVNMALYYITGPVVSAFINRFGFRISAMVGSIVVSLAYFTSYFAQAYAVLILFYGVISGIGGCFISMSSHIVVGFYFERLRGIAMALTGLGTSVGVTVMYKVNSYLVQLAGWRTTTLFHSGLLGTIYFIAMLYRPLLSLSMTTEKEDFQTVTYLPSLSTVAMKAVSRAQMKEQKPGTTRTERLFGAVSNVHFPRAAEVFEEAEEDTDDEAGPSSGSTEKLTFKVAINTKGAISQRQLKQVQSMMSRRNLVDNENQIKITVNNVEQDRKHHWWKRCCHWEKHVKETRPMYRDDVFYNGTVQNLQVYDKYMKNTKDRNKTGFEYQMAVTRAVATSDLKERKGVFTTAVRRVLATMLDPQLLRRNSFFMVCISAFLIFLGILVPFIFIPDRNKSKGIDDVHCNSFVSVIGFSNGIGRLVAGLLSCKFNPIGIYSLGSILAGSGLILSNLSFNPYYQYFCCAMFGFSAALVGSTRSLVIVKLYGLDKLTNATGMILMFQGFGSLLSTSIAGILKNSFGYDVVFYFAGSCIVSGGLVMVNVKRVAKSEERKMAKLVVGKFSSVTKRKRKSLGNLAPIPEK